MIAVASEAVADVPDESLETSLIERVDALNHTLDKHERIGALIVTRTPWTQDEGLLTHTLKMKRDVVEERYASEIVAAGERMREGESHILIRSQ